MTPNRKGERENEQGIAWNSRRVLCGGVRNADSGGAAIYLDGVEIAGSAAIFDGTHTVTARTDAELACIALYESRRLVTASFSGSLEYDFPESGAEIAL